MKPFALLILVVSVFSSLPVQGQQVIKCLDKTACLKELQADNFVVVDVRTPQEFQQGHIENALNYNYYEADFSQKIAKIDRKQKILIYCEIGGRSADAVKQLEKMGFEYIVEVRGGFRSWRKT